MKTSRRAAAFAAVALVAGAVAATPADAAPALSWGDCPPDTVYLGQQCTTVLVPVDHDAPHGEKIPLAVSRIPAARPELRRGALLLIPGGPGNPGLSRPWTVGARLPQRVRDRYDIIGFDPRGVGRSAPISCGLPLSDVTRLSAWPAPDGDITADVERARRIADACARTAGPLLRHIGTIEEARDVDRIRRALGEARISYWAHSYGTYVGAVHSTLFPGTTDRVLLDSNDEPDPEALWRTVLANMAIGVEDRFPDFARWASLPGNPLRLAGSPGEVRPLYLALAARLDREPLGAFDGNALREVVLRGMGTDAGFEAIARTMTAARDRVPPPTAPLPPEAAMQNTLAVATATICNDVAWPTSVAHYQRAVLVDRQRHPMTAGMPANITPCAFWPHPADRPVRISAAGPSNILLLQSLRDPATPYSGALRMREALGGRARMVAVSTGGHGVYVTQGSACGDALATEFLVSGHRPDRDVLCP